MRKALLLTVLFATSAQAQTDLVNQDEARLMEGCQAGGDSDLVCQCVVDDMHRAFTPSEYTLAMAMIVSGMTGDKARAQEIVALFGSDMQAFGNFAKDARSVLDKAFTECRAAAPQ